jgi:hypothetical protein
MTLMSVHPIIAGSVDAAPREVIASFENEDWSKARICFDCSDPSA